MILSYQQKSPVHRRRSSFVNRWLAASSLTLTQYFQKGKNGIRDGTAMPFRGCAGLSEEQWIFPVSRTSDKIRDTKRVWRDFHSSSRNPKRVYITCSLPSSRVIPPETKDQIIEMKSSLQFGWASNVDCFHRKSRDESSNIESVVTRNEA